MANVLVFGASGAVGSTAAIEARKRGAKVWLAMRDVNKSVQQLAEEEKKGGYERIQADLSEPATVAAAVKKSGATAAFVYTLWGSPDAMKATFTALKDAGITYLVLLSSYSVKVPPSSTDTTQIVPKVHAETEIALGQISGLRTVVLHPAYFSSNLFMFAQAVQQGVVELYHPNAVLDFLAPGDIGAVAGSLLVTQAQDGVIPLNGPELIKLGDALRTVGRAGGKAVEVRELDEAGFLAKFSFLPEPIAKSLAATFEEYDGDATQLYPEHAEAVANVTRLSGREPTKLAVWAEHVKGAFSG